MIGRSRPLARSLLMFFRAYRAYRAGISPLSNFCDHGLCSGARWPEIRPNIATALPVRCSVGLTECALATSATARPFPDWPQHDIAGRMAFFLVGMLTAALRLSGAGRRSVSRPADGAARASSRPPHRRMRN